MLAVKIPVPWLHQKGKGKAKGPVYIKSEDEGSEATSKATQGKAKATGFMWSPSLGVPSAIQVEDRVFASGECLQWVVEAFEANGRAWIRQQAEALWGL